MDDRAEPSRSEAWAGRDSGTATDNLGRRLGARSAGGAGFGQRPLAALRQPLPPGLVGAGALAGLSGVAAGAVARKRRRRGGGEADGAGLEERRRSGPTRRSNERAPREIGVGAIAGARVAGARARRLAAALSAPDRRAMAGDEAMSDPLRDPPSDPAERLSPLPRRLPPRAADGAGAPVDDGSGGGSGRAADPTVARAAAALARLRERWRWRVRLGAMALGLAAGLPLAAAALRFASGNVRLPLALAALVAPPLLAWWI